MKVTFYFFFFFFGVNGGNGGKNHFSYLTNIKVAIFVFFFRVFKAVSLNFKSLSIKKNLWLIHQLLFLLENSNNFEKFFVSTSNFQINSQLILKDQKINVIPDWIKNNAGWWADGSIDDASFIQGIQFLIKEGILKI